MPTQYARSSYDTFIKQEEDNIESSFAELDLTVQPHVNKYLELNNTRISTEEVLDDTEIVELVLAEQQQKEQDSDDSDEEPLKILVSEGLAGLKKFVEFFEQQIDQNFKSEDLNIFRKYLAIMRRKDVESKKQSFIMDYFILAEEN
ncbi:15498_t:CDS:2 [Cetraspora pellucida]|uniref:15498_t:CDS:1 n=1 Tax=Cetraspora pellucida TaxID=1433469 RepID=A0ACA9LS51_9GLOM|nr:15498_t:CDS:2 [Cetraspora pellucida]